MPRLLIFGMCGFVGPHLANEFVNHGYEVYGSDKIESYHSPLLKEYYSSDILNKESISHILKEVNPTHIINLAAISSVGQSWKLPKLTVEVNVLGTLNIFEACLENNIKPKILLIGSSEEYIPSDKPLDEKMEINANNPYGISKIAQEQFASLYREKYNWDIYCVRAFNHIGTGQRDTFVIPSWCKQVAQIEKGEKEPVIVVGNLEVSRDFADVRDIVRAYRLVIESKYPNEVFNIGRGEALPLREILNMIISFSTKKIDVKVDQALLRPNDNKVICCNPAKAERMLGWKAEVSFKQTLQELFEYFIKQ